MNRQGSSTPVAAANLRIQRSDEDGSALIEAALAVPFLVTLIMGIVQYGFVFAAHVSLRSTAAATARYVAILNGNIDYRDSSRADELESAVQAALSPMLDNSTSRFSVAVSHIAVGEVGDARQITIDYDLDLFVPFVVPGASGGNLQIRTVAVMR